MVLSDMILIFDKDLQFSKTAFKFELTLRIWELSCCGRHSLESCNDHKKIDACFESDKNGNSAGFGGLNKDFFTKDSIYELRYSSLNKTLCTVEY